MKFPLQLLIAAAFAAWTPNSAAGDTFQAALRAPAAAHPSLYSFADVYRLTVSGAAMAGFPAAAGEQPLRVALTQGAPGAAGIQFSVAALPEPGRWLMLLAGLAAAGWVARRRLGYGS